MGKLSLAQKNRIAEIRKRVDQIQAAAYLELLGKLINDSPIGLMGVAVATDHPSRLQEIVGLQREYDAIMESGPATFDPSTGTWTLPQITIRQGGTLIDQVPEIEITDNREDDTLVLPEIEIVQSGNASPATSITIHPVVILITDFDDPPPGYPDATVSTDAGGNAVITIPEVVINFALGQDAVDSANGQSSEGTDSEGTDSEGTDSEGTDSEGTGSEGTGSEGPLDLDLADKPFKLL